MQKRENQKVLSLVLGVALLALTFVDVDAHAVGIYRGCPLSNRLLYPFFHAHLVHAAMNVWVLIQLAYIYGLPYGRLAVAYIVATTYPTMSAGPTVGLSGVLFYLFGRMSFEVERRWYWQRWMLLMLLLGIVLPGVDGWVHTYCYGVGVLMALLNYPIRR